MRTPPPGIDQKTIIVPKTCSKPHFEQITDKKLKMVKGVKKGSSLHETDQSYGYVGGLLISLQTVSNPTDLMNQPIITQQ